MSSKSSLKKDKSQCNDSKNHCILSLVTAQRIRSRAGYVEESTGYIRIKNKAGMSYDKKITRTDLTLKVIKNLGAKALRAYDETEQKSTH
jgi:hypothetical protein